MSAGRLYLVATPIGNLEDVTLRALRVLREVDLLLVEDTRRTRILLDRHGVEVKSRPLSFHAHNEAARCQRALEVLGASGSVAVVSDAGTPLVSDPGERLAIAAREAGHEVVAIPGASAVLAALLVSGLPVSRFSFVGFPPRKAGERTALFESLSERAETLVFFESPRRLSATLRQLSDVLGQRAACVARELTKIHEEAVHGSLAELAERFSDGARGEVTLVVAGAPEALPADPRELDDAIRLRIREGGRSREIAAELAGEWGLPRREVYARVLALRGEDEGAV